MNFVKHYQSAKKLLKPPGAWLKGAWARSDSGEIVGWTDPRAGKFCLSGALRNVDPTRKLTERTREYLQEYAGTRIIPEWNDSQKTVKKIVNFINYCIRQEKTRERSKDGVTTSHS